MTRYRLVGDVGGTNTRLGLARGGALKSDTISSFRNGDYAGFEAVVQDFAATIGADDFDEAVIAVAGPVSQGRARLTNRDWTFDAVALATRFALTRAVLLNDLTALGHAVPHLDAPSVEQIIEASPEARGVRQALVVGIGTGFNVSPVIAIDQGVVCPVAEFGHVQLPRDIHDHLSSRLGSAAADFDTVESCFSGRGFQRVRESLDAVNDESFHEFYGELLGLLCRNLVLAFMPGDGIYFAGGVARNLWATPARESFAGVFRQPLALELNLAVPVHSILDDTAALRGCAGLAMSR